jgi:heme a synthase
MMINRQFARFTWGVLAYNIVVILWGAFVRATGSGAGCGSHWPTCNGAIVPRPEQIETTIEFIHRLTSGIAFLLVLAMLIWAFRSYPKGHLVRAGTAYSMLFMVLEALLGASLVLFGWVDNDDSIARAYSMGIHLVNTFLLLGALTLTGWWASGGNALRLRNQGNLIWILGATFAGNIVLGASGAITALGDTLVLQAGLSPQDSPLVAQLVSMRVYHPLSAFAVGGLILLAVSAANSRQPSQPMKRTGQVLIGLFSFQLFLGALNVVLRAPVWMQLVHLFFADTIWIALILLSAQALAHEEAEVPASELPRTAFQTGD